ncbi:MAG: endonuclease III domain-containing protein [Oscillospiraceae bacterium]|nr:endonuclease III domain-containing protein [Oscillospiraceae bacterium]
MRQASQRAQQMDDMMIKLYESLLAHYGNLHWWPAKTPYEVIVGAILTQNTAWSNVEKAIANFGDGLLPETIEKADVSEIAELIRPSGFFNQKAAYLKTVTAWFAKYRYDVTAVRRAPLEKLRAELLSVKGIGQETADSILLYAFDFPSFVVDAYTVRLCERYPINAGKGYSRIKLYFEQNLPQNVEIYNNFHAMIVINAKDHCRKKPVCGVCPLNKTCVRTAVGGVEITAQMPGEERHGGEGKGRVGAGRIGPGKTRPGGGHARGGQARGE